MVLHADELVLEAVDRCRDTALAADECLAAVFVYWHYRGISQQSSELYGIAYILAFYWDYTYGCSLLVDHSDGSLVSDDA